MLELNPRNLLTLPVLKQHITTTTLYISTDNAKLNAVIPRSSAVAVTRDGNRTEPCFLQKRTEPNELNCLTNRTEPRDLPNRTEPELCTMGSVPTDIHSICSVQLSKYTLFVSYTSTSLQS